jgi:ligand-binding sensor domain-containing protein
MTTSRFHPARRNNNVLITCLLIVLISANASAQSPLSGLPFVKNFQTVEYKAGIQNWDIVQDKRGILYIANNFGLLEYDGQQWHTYGVKSGTKVRSVAIDRQGKIFVGCQGDFGYFFPNDRGQLTYTSLADSLAPQYRNFDEAWSIFIDLDRVYFCTFSLIYVYEHGELSIIKPENPIDLSFLVNRQLFVNERDKVVSLLDGDRLTLLPSFHSKSINILFLLHNAECLRWTMER